MDGKYYLDTLDVILDKVVFDEISSMTTGESLYPLFTFHSTQSTTAIAGILKYGYILPGHIHPTQGTSTVSHLISMPYYKDPEMKSRRINPNEI